MIQKGDATMALDFALGRTRVNEIELHGVRSLKSGRFTITGVTIDGQLLLPTHEFWEDLFTRYRLTSGWAESKSYARRFEWLAAHHGLDEIPYRVLWDETGNAWIAPSRRRKIRRRKIRRHKEETKANVRNSQPITARSPLRCLPQSIGEHCTSSDNRRAQVSAAQTIDEHSNRNMLNWLSHRRRRIGRRTK